MKKMFVTLATSTGLALASVQPAFAQEMEEATAEETVNVDDPISEAFAELGGMFAVEPLTPEEEMRLPLATRIIEKMIPEGTMAEMMGSMFDDMLGPMMELGGSPAQQAVAEKIGVTTFELDLTEEQAAELASVFDPNWQERHDRQMALFPQMMADMMTAMEPGMRKAMSELYAINFSDQELTEIDAFFSTETGAAFARKSFTMASDPRIMSATMESLPAMMGGFENLEQQMEESVADLPDARPFADLSDTEKARITELTGYSAEEIESNISISTFSFDDWDAGDAAEDAAEAAE
ncbi:MAG: DUF2059 domain-containing protein [Pseudomonadota bacterium]